MKKIRLAVFFMFFTAGLFANPKASIEWQTNSIDMGAISFKKPVTVEFVFKNKGLVPLVITNVESSCGCTVPEYPKQPVTSGQNGKILVTYDADTEGQFSKTITVYSNSAEGKTQLYIKGFVVRQGS
jgi:hypothetical protein